jgi:death-on-curing protein
VLAIHDDQIERYGGSAGGRDRGLRKPLSTARRPATTPTSSRRPPPCGKASRKTIPSSTATSGRPSPPPTPFSPSTARIAADAKAAYVFIAGLYETNDFTFEKLAAWLRDNV